MQLVTLPALSVQPTWLQQTTQQSATSVKPSAVQRQQSSLAALAYAYPQITFGACLGCLLTFINEDYQRQQADHIKKTGRFNPYKEAKDAMESATHYENFNPKTIHDLPSIVHNARRNRLTPPTTTFIKYITDGAFRYVPSGNDDQWFQLDKEHSRALNHAVLSGVEAYGILDKPAN